jgi:HTH-type transcriptional regulator/antitoxin HigA
VDLIREVPRVLAEHGVRFVVVEPLSRNKIDGATLWLDDQSPVLAVSLRYDRIDGFWYTVMHEAAHNLHQDGEGLVLDVDLLGEGATASGEKPDFEVRADSLAADWLVPSRRLEEFMREVRPRYSKVRISSFANELGVHPGIVVGRLQHRREISYSNHREMLVRVRDVVTETAATDGWGASGV